mmetsp:Transcript_58258/g.126525  ORF Transcript_58258/g.126525 Transcript_58258/m.126525 type:complete len:210 (-) Transcript_58258:646-1275(-)
MRASRSVTVAPSLLPPTSQKTTDGRSSAASRTTREKWASASIISKRMAGRRDLARKRTERETSSAQTRGLREAMISVASPKEHPISRTTSALWICDFAAARKSVVSAQSSSARPRRAITGESWATLAWMTSPARDPSVSLSAARPEHVASAVICPSAFCLALHTPAAPHHNSTALRQTCRAHTWVQPRSLTRNHVCILDIYAKTLATKI